MCGQEGQQVQGVSWGFWGLCSQTGTIPLLCPCPYSESEGVLAQVMLSSGASHTEVSDVRDVRVQLGGRRLTVSASVLPCNPDNVLGSFFG